MNRIVDIVDIVDTGDINSSKSNKSNKLRQLFALPTSVNDHNMLVNHNYTITQLKLIAKSFHLKVSGSKTELTTRIHTHMTSYKYALQIQNAYRHHLSNKYRSLIRFRDTVNDSDFLSMEKLSTLDKCQFFSFNDKDGFVYGFDALSFYQLTVINGIKENPYNRCIFHQDTIDNFKTLVRLANCLKLPLNIKMEQDILTLEQEQELRIVELFQTINSLGNYANYQWFTALDPIRLIRLLKELCDIWTFRSQMPDTTKYHICPSGNPFRRMGLVKITQPIYDIRDGILTILETIITTGIDKDSQTLGSYYTLCALTLVSYDASIALPWLYQSVQPYY